MARWGYAFQQQQNGASATHREARYSNHVSTTHHHHQVAGLLDQGCLISGGGGLETATWHSHGGFIIPNRALLFKNGSDTLFNASSQFSNFGTAAMRDSELEAFREVRVRPHATVRTEEVSYERRSWAGDGSNNYGFFNEVDGFNNNKVNRNGFTRVEWISKG